MLLKTAGVLTTIYSSQSAAAAEHQNRPFEAFLIHLTAEPAVSSGPEHSRSIQRPLEGFGHSREHGVDASLGTNKPC